MSNINYRQHLAQLSAAHSIQDPVLILQQQAEARLNSTPQNSRSTAYQSRQVHPVQSQSQSQPSNQATETSTLRKTLYQTRGEPQPRAKIDGTLQNSRSTAHTSRQIYTVQSQPQLQPFNRATGSSTLHDTLSIDDSPSGILSQFLTQLRDQQQYMNASLAKLVSAVSSIGETVDGLTNKLETHDRVLEKLERSGCDDNRTNAKKIDVMKVLVGEMKSLKKTLGRSCDGDDGRTVLGRLDAVTFAVGELLERARDPEANLSEPTSITVIPPIDLTSPSPGPPPVRCTPPFQSHTYVDVGTSPVPSPPPLKEKYFASIQVGSSDPFESFFQSPEESTPYSGRFSSTHTLVDNTNASPNMGLTALTQERLELVAPTPMNVDLIGSTNPTPDPQICTSESTISTNYPEDATQVQIESQLSETTPVTMEMGPRVENIAMHPVMHSDLASPESAQTPQNITGPDGLAHTNDRSVDHNTGSLNVTPGPKSDISTFEQPYIHTSTATSSASPALPPDNMDSEKLTVDADRRGHNEEKISASKKAKEYGKDKEEIKRIEKRGFELNRNHDGDVPVPTPGLIDLSQHLRDRPRSSSSCFASPSTSLTSLFGGIAGSTRNVDSSENVSIFSRSPVTKSYSPTRTKVLVGASRSPRSVFHAAAAPPSTPPTSIIASTSNSMKIPLTTPTREAASVVSSQLVLQPTTTDAGPVTAAPTNNIASQAIETSLLRDLSPLSDMESDAETGEGMTKDTDGQVADDFLKKRDTSLGDDADIVRAKKRRISEGSSTVKRGLSLEKESPVVKGKPSLLSLFKAGKKGESAAITRVKKRKVTSDFVIDGEVEGKGEHDDGLDQERPLKRARQRVSERQMKMESLEKGKRLTREFSGSSFGAESSSRVVKSRFVASGSGIVATRNMKPSPSASTSAKVRKSGPPSKGGSARGPGKVEVEWPEMTQGDETEDLVECNRCQAWYHYGCVGITADDTRLHNGKKYLCPPCEAGTFITKLSTDTQCWRPGCVVPAGFIVEKIIGRFKKVVDGQEIQFKYLLRWKGYKLSEATWEPEESMYDPSFMIDKFRIDAFEEGVDIDKDKTGLVLLRIAKHPCVPKPT